MVAVCNTAVLVGNVTVIGKLPGVVKLTPACAPPGPTPEVAST